MQKKEFCMKMTNFRQKTNFPNDKQFKNMESFNISNQALPQNWLKSKFWHPYLAWKKVF